MNVNLISPQENGNSFVVRFKDDIIIPENSKVYLNFASFSRENDIELYEDQTLKLVFQNADVYPSILTYAPFADNALLNNIQFTIPSGTYNYQKLYTLITTGINGLLQDNSNPVDMSMYKAISIADIDNNDSQIVAGNVSFSLGLMKNSPQNLPHKAFTIDPTNFNNCNNDSGNIAYQKTSINVNTNTGLLKSGSSPAYTNGITGTNSIDKLHNNYTNIALTTTTGSGNGASIDFTVDDLGIDSSLTAPFGASFETVGSSNKDAGPYTNVILLKADGNPSGIKVSLTVTGTLGTTGPIDFTSIVVSDAGIGGGNVINDILTISNTQTSGTEDTKIKIVKYGGSINYASIRVNQIGTNYSTGDILTIPNTGGIGGTADSQTIISSLQGGAGEPLFDNYALSSDHYWHIGYDDDTPIENQNIIKFTTKQTINQMMTADGSVSLGLFSQEVALGITGKNGSFPNDSDTRTGGTSEKVPNGTNINPRNVPDEGTNGSKQIASFFHVEVNCRGAAPYLKIWVAKKSDQQTLKGWSSCNHKITGMKNSSLNGGNGIRIADMSSVNLDEPLTIGIQTYYDTDELKTVVSGAGKLYFRVLNMNGNIDGKKSIKESSIVIYDSKSTPNVLNQSHFPPLFFKPSNTNVNLDIDRGGINADMTKSTLDIGTGNRTAGTSDVLLTGGSGYGAVLSVPRVPKTAGSNEIGVGALPQTNLVEIINIGSGVRKDGTYANQVLGGGSGTGGKCTIVIVSNEIDPEQLVITDCGTGYVSGDVLTIPITQIEGTADGTITLDEVQSVKLVKSGDGYKVGDILNIGGIGGNNDAKLTINSDLNFNGLINRINSQLPFNIIVSSLKQLDGFESISIPAYTKNNNKPTSLLVKYEIETTEELSRYLGFNTLSDRTEGYSDILFPNTGDAMNKNLVHLEGMTLDWRNESYSVSIKELPIKNYKNNDKLRSGGFSKPILANCPVPFSDSQSYRTKSKQMITATYKPNYQVISNLYNQQMTTNKFSVDINKLQSEKPANEIKKSIINFTILPPDDYKGNINSVESLRNF